MIRTPEQIEAEIAKRKYSSSYWRDNYILIYAEYLKLKAAFDKLESTHAETECPNCACSMAMQCDCGHDPASLEDCECDFCRSNREEDAEDHAIQGDRL